jgi:hypothetical protein
MSNIRFPFWQEVRKLLVDRLDGTHAERVEAYPPKVLMTDHDGPYARMRVDVGQTGFFAGREFRTFQEFTIASGASVTIRATVPNDIILFDTSVSVDSGIIRMDLYAGGTADGPWTAMPVIRKNTMSVAPVVANQVTLHYDGGLTGGILIDRTRISASSLGGVGSSVGASQGSERGVGAGTYYYTLTNEGNQPAKVIFKGHWEERV